MSLIKENVFVGLIGYSGIDQTSGNKKMVKNGQTLTGFGHIERTDCLAGIGQIFIYLFICYEEIKRAPFQSIRPIQTNI